MTTNTTSLPEPTKGSKSKGVIKKAPERLSKKEFKEKWRNKITALHYEDLERKLNQQL